jgi:uncharacterized protein (DUF885 family)
MRRLFKWLFGMATLAALLLGGLFVNYWFFKPVTIDWFYDRAFLLPALDHPEMLSEERMVPHALAFFYNDKLDDASPSQDERDAASDRGNLDLLRRYDRSKLKGETALSYDVLESLWSSAVEGQKYRDYDFPLNQLDGVQISLPQFFVQVHEVTELQEARAYVRRLNKIPVKFDQILESLKARESHNLLPPQFSVTKAIAQMRGFIGTPPQQNELFVSFKAKLDKVATSEIDATQRDRLLAQVNDSIANSVYPAYERLIAYATQLQAHAQGNYGAWHLPDGDAYYAYRVRQQTTTEMTPQQVHDLGLSEVARIAGELDESLKTLGMRSGTVAQRLQQLTHDPVQRFTNDEHGRRALLASYQAILDEASHRVGAAFDVRPKASIVASAVPDSAQNGAAIAYYEPGSIDGARPGVFYANLRDTADMPKFEMRNIAFHEGIPGHHFQMSIAQELTGLPIFRRVLPFTAYTEGWGLYAERLAWELGLENTELDNIGRLRWDMLRAVRLVVDSGIHYKRWTREQAIQYMTEHTGQESEFVGAEIERYFVYPGQALAYKVGMLEILSLREKAKAALGDKFKLAQFHDAVLTHGALPLAVLERVIDEWIEKQKAT